MVSKRAVDLAFADFCVFLTLLTAAILAIKILA